MLDVVRGSAAASRSAPLALLAGNSMTRCMTRRARRARVSGTAGWAEQAGVTTGEEGDFTRSAARKAFKQTNSIMQMEINGICSCVQMEAFA